MNLKTTMAALTVALGLIASETIYPATFVIDKVDYNTDEVRGVDANGNAWSFYGVEDWDPNDLCAVIMYNNGTPDNIYDDIILTTRYVGTVEMLEVQGK